MGKFRLLPNPIFFCLLVIVLCNTCMAQTGSFTATFTPQNTSVKPVTISFTKPLFKFDNPHGYWFVNPYTGARHFNTMPDQGYGDVPNFNVGFLTFNETANDFDFYTLTSNDSDAIMLQNAGYYITAPAYNVQLGDKNKPLHVHINSFTNAEISFALSGTAEMSNSIGNGEKLGFGTITGTGHFYREPKFIKSDILPGCNCDPTIYATVYDQENNVRTTSACETALNNKIFDAVQKSMSGLFTNVNYNSPERPLPAGAINITMMAGCTNIDVPVKQRPYCSSDYYHNWLTGIDAHKKLFTSDDRYGLRFIKIPDNSQMGFTEDADANRKKQLTMIDSISKLMQAKKISMQEYTKAVQDFAANINQNAPDLKKLEAESNLYLTVIINPSNNTETELKLADKDKTVVTHAINGAAFEIYSPIIKEDDGNWTKSRCAIYLGKFTNPLMGKSGGGFDAETTNAVYPANANKLTVYNIIIKMEGGKDLMDKAVANIDFSALLGLIAKQ
ncbi:hypothetical protein [Parasediminibacterium sp. JCM 36343]|uniref:hypothetical protein n=1 Tax=Parasediminibacterium sp. JCM 36343 TaxID=3374279 RepID=UPI00397A22A5